MYILHASSRTLPRTLNQSTPFTDVPFHSTNIGNQGDSLREHPLEALETDMPSSSRSPCIYIRPSKFESIEISKT